MLQDVFSSERWFTFVHFNLQPQIFLKHRYYIRSFTYTLQCLLHHGIKYPALLWSCLLSRRFCFSFHLAFCTQNTLTLSYSTLHGFSYLTNFIHAALSALDDLSSSYHPKPTLTYLSDLSLELLSQKIFTILPEETKFLLLYGFIVLVFFM